ncbi:MAG: RICIN domain-containing protein [Faecalibacterium sp.]
MAKASQVVLLENEYYLIKAPNGKVLEVKNFNTENGASIRLWDYAGHPWQQWQFVDAGEDRWRIQNRFTGKMIDLAMGGVVEGTWLHQWSRTSGLSQCWALEPTRSGRTRIRNVLADKYIDLVGMNTANGAQAQIWRYVADGNQEWNLVRVDANAMQTSARAQEQPEPTLTPSQRKHKNDDLVSKLNSAGKGRPGRRG